MINNMDLIYKLSSYSHFPLQLLANIYLYPKINHLIVEGYLKRGERLTKSVRKIAVHKEWEMLWKILLSFKKDRR